MTGVVRAHKVYRNYHEFLEISPYYLYNSLVAPKLYCIV